MSMTGGRFWGGFAVGIVSAMIALALAQRIAQREVRHRVDAADARAMAAARTPTWTPTTPEEAASAQRRLEELVASYDPFTKVTLFQYRTERYQTKIVPQIALWPDGKVTLQIRAQQHKLGVVAPTNTLFESRGIVAASPITRYDAYRSDTGTIFEAGTCPADTLSRVLEDACTADALNLRWEGRIVADLERDIRADWEQFKAVILIFRAARQEPGLLTPAARRAGARI